MPNDDGSEPINVATDLNDNLEKLDNTIGFVPSTVASPPSSTYNGMASYETDTGRAKFLKASTWTYLLTAGASFLSDLLLGAANKIGIGTTTPSAIVDVVVSSITSSPLMRYKQVSESNARFQIDSDGISIGSGAASPDTRIYRPTANQLAITGSVSMANNLSVSGSTLLGAVNITGDLDLDGNIAGNLNVNGNISATGSGYINSLRKLADTARNNTNTATNDPDLFFFAQANTTYFIELYLIYSGDTSGDFKTSWYAPTGTSGVTRWVLGEANAGTDRENTQMRTAIHGYATEVAYGAHSATLFNGALETMTLTTSTTAGNIGLKWAQTITTATSPTTVRAGSLLMWRIIA